jgi:exonuclease III
MHVVQIARVNINGIRNEIRVGMLRDFIRSHDLDIVLVQEVTAPESVDNPRYTSYTNIGSEMRGTAIIARQDLQITHIDKIPSGREIAVVFCGIRIINIYAPSGTAKRTEQERFFNAELPVPLYEYTHPILIGGDFNCILQPIDSTGPFTSSNALADIVRGLRLTDMWKQVPRHPTYTHYSTTGVTRIDRIYQSTADKERKTGIEIIPTAYTDYHVVVLRLSIPTTERQRIDGRWKMDPDIVQGSTFKTKFQTEREKWRGHKRYYPEMGMWWERDVKTNIKRLPRQVEIEGNKNNKIMEKISKSANMTTCKQITLRQTNYQPCRNIKRK